jgi:hypothetical protein
MQRFSFVDVLAEPERVRSNFVGGYKAPPVRLHGSPSKCNIARTPPAAVPQDK